MHKCDIFYLSICGVIYISFLHGSGRTASSLRKLTSSTSATKSVQRKSVLMLPKRTQGSSPAREVQFAGSEVWRPSGPTNSTRMIPWLLNDLIGVNSKPFSGWHG